MDREADAIGDAPVGRAAQRPRRPGSLGLKPGSGGYSVLELCQLAAALKPGSGGYSVLELCQLAAALSGAASKAELAHTVFETG